MRSTHLAQIARATAESLSSEASEPRIKQQHNYSNGMHRKKQIEGNIVPNGQHLRMSTCQGWRSQSRFLPVAISIPTRGDASSRNLR